MQVTGTTPIIGQFPHSGPVYEVNMAGGFTTTERMIENGPDGFRYQIWDLTAPLGPVD